MPWLCWCVVAGVIAIGVPAPAPAQTSPSALPDSLLVGLSDSARATIVAYAAASDSTARLNDAWRLAVDSTAGAALIALIPREPNAWVRSTMVRRLAGRFGVQARYYPPARAMLKTLLATDPDSTVVAEALYQLTKLEGTELRSIVDQRIGGANVWAQGAPVPSWLQTVQERAIALNNGWVTPLFLRTPPPVFAAAPAGKPVRVLAFGDWGTGLANQRTAADAMRRYHVRHRFTFGITLGDNFYTFGLPSPTHVRWQTQYEALYSPMGIKLYASLGNHDQYDGDSPAAEMVRSYLSPTWRMPAAYYTFTAGPAQFFAIDGNDLSVRQLAWLKAALEQSTARWKVVYGHFPIDVAADVGPAYTAEMREKLLPILLGRADVYLAGHHHSTQHLKPIDGVNLFIAGSGGTTGYPSDSTKPNALFARTIPGFTVLEINQRTFTVRFINDQNEEMYVAMLHKPAP